MASTNIPYWDAEKHSLGLVFPSCWSTTSRVRSTAGISECFVSLMLSTSPYHLQSNLENYCENGLDESLKQDTHFCRTAGNLRSSLPRRLGNINGDGDVVERYAAFTESMDLINRETRYNCSKPSLIMLYFGLSLPWFKSVLSHAVRLLGTDFARDPEFGMSTVLNEARLRDSLTEISHSWKSELAVMESQPSQHLSVTCRRRCVIDAR